MSNITYYITRISNKLLRFNAIKNSNVSKSAKLTHHIQFIDSSIKRYSYVGEYSIIVDTEIGAFCSIADNCIIGGPAHAIHFVSTSPVFVRGRNIFGCNLSNNEFDGCLKTRIGNDVWIGSGAMIKAGVSIGNGSIIGMGSVVTHDIGDYEIWAGNPARLIRKRFETSVSDRLIKSKWWDFDETKLKELGQLFCSPEKMLEKLRDDDF